MITYNTKNIHSATGQTPLEATKKGNEFKSKLNVSIQAKRRRTYPELEVRDKVKISRKQLIPEKERTSHFQKGNFTVNNISTKLGQKHYDLEGFGRPLMRHELLKVCSSISLSTFVLSEPYHLSDNCSRRYGGSLAIICSNTCPSFLVMASRLSRRDECWLLAFIWSTASSTLAWASRWRASSFLFSPEPLAMDAIRMKMLGSCAKLLQKSK